MVTQGALIEPTGQQLRDKGVADVIAADMAPYRNAGPFIKAAISRLADKRWAFTASDVRKELEEHPAVIQRLNDSPNLLPAYFSAAASAGQIRVVGYTKSTRRARHSGRIAMWVGV